MIPRYSTPEMSAIWTDEARMAAWLDVELAVCDAWAELGRFPWMSSKRFARRRASTWTG